MAQIEEAKAGSAWCLPFLLPACLAGICLWAYGTTLGALARAWSSDPQYSHGYLVPLFAAFLLRGRWKQYGPAGANSSWWGVPFLAAALLLRLAAADLNLDWIDGVSLLLCLAGLFVLCGGWPALRWAWPAIAFLIFMVPLPYRVAHGLAGPLQSLATRLSAYLMQTVGLPAITEGNVILVNDSRIAVVEACSGLSMLFIFIALSTGVALLLRRPLLDRLVVLFSAIPIAILANMLRITVTGIVIELFGKRMADLVFHNLAGWLMMPLALVLLWLELKLVDFLLLAPGHEAPGLLGQDAQARGRASMGKAAEKMGDLTSPLPASSKEVCTKDAV